MDLCERTESDSGLELAVSEAFESSSSSSPDTKALLIPGIIRADAQIKCWTEVVLSPVKVRLR